MPQKNSIPGKLVSNYIGKMYEFQVGGKPVHVSVKRNEGIKEAREILLKRLEPVGPAISSKRFAAESQKLKSQQKGSK